jgi:hypothetical protein
MLPSHTEGTKWDHPGARGQSRWSGAAATWGLSFAQAPGRASFPDSFDFGLGGVFGAMDGSQAFTHVKHMLSPGLHPPPLQLEHLGRAA